MDEHLERFYYEIVNKPGDDFQVVVQSGNQIYFRIMDSLDERPDFVEVNSNETLIDLQDIGKYWIEILEVNDGHQVDRKWLEVLRLDEYDVGLVHVETIFRDGFVLFRIDEGFKTKLLIGWNQNGTLPLPDNAIIRNGGDCGEDNSNVCRRQLHETHQMHITQSSCIYFRIANETLFWSQVRSVCVDVLPAPSSGPRLGLNFSMINFVQVLPGDTTKSYLHAYTSGFWLLGGFIWILGISVAILISMPFWIVGCFVVWTNGAPFKSRNTTNANSLGGILQNARILLMLEKISHYIAASRVPIIGVSPNR